MLQKYLPRENPALYEINAAAWLYSLSVKPGKPVRLGSVPAAEWDRLKRLGMDYVWLMGVWTRSQTGRRISLTDPGFHRLFNSITPNWTEEDIIGSCYSVSAYEPDPLVGTWEDIDYVRRELHQRGMGLILDFIPNHTGIDHHWTREHPEYYVQVQKEDYLKDKEAFFPIDYQSQTLYLAHGRDPNFPAWTDTAQINYFNPEARAALIREIEKIARHCDGIRCDMAMLMLNDVFQRVWEWTNHHPGYTLPAEEFWAQAVHEVPNLIYVAEAYWDTEWTLQQLGFDFVYDKRLYDRMRNGHPNDVYLHLTADIHYQNKLVRFIENHDEQRSRVTFPGKKLEAAAVLFSTLPGLKLFFHGQMEGKRIRLPVQIRRSKPETVDPAVSTFYEKLLPIINEDTFHSGNWQLRDIQPHQDDSSQNLIAYTWKLENQTVLVTVNLGQDASQGIVDIKDIIMGQSNFIFYDRLKGQSFLLENSLTADAGFVLSLEDKLERSGCPDKPYNASRKLILQLDGYQAHIFEIRPVN
jgi:hypothetical protein